MPRMRVTYEQDEEFEFDIPTYPRPRQIVEMEIWSFDGETVYIQNEELGIDMEVPWNDISAQLDVDSRVLGEKVKVAFA